MKREGEDYVMTLG